MVGDFPGGPAVENPPANAGGKGMIPSPGISHMPMGQLGLCTTATELEP